LLSSTQNAELLNCKHCGTYSYWWALKVEYSSDYTVTRIKWVKEGTSFINLLRAGTSLKINLSTIAALREEDDNL
jgi:hypothetical protein